MLKIHKQGQFNPIHSSEGLHHLCRNSDLCVPATFPKEQHCPFLNLSASAGEMDPDQGDSSSIQTPDLPKGGVSLSHEPAWTTSVIKQSYALHFPLQCYFCCFILKLVTLLQKLLIKLSQFLSPSEAERTTSSLE